jgi:hypothetical protein
MRRDDEVKQCSIPARIKKEKKRQPRCMKLPLCAGSGEGLDHLGSLYAALPYNFCNRLFPRLEPVTSWSQGDSFNHCTKAPLQREKKKKGKNSGSELGHLLELMYSALLHRNCYNQQLYYTKVDPLF